MSSRTIPCSGKGTLYDFTYLAAGVDWRSTDPADQAKIAEIDARINQGLDELKALERDLAQMAAAGLADPTVYR